MKPLSSHTENERLNDGVEQDHAEVRVVQPELAVHQEDRDGDDDGGSIRVLRMKKSQSSLPGMSNRLKA